LDYWLDLFTGTTWKEFRSAGSHISGFRSGQKRMVDSIRPGDILICYLTGVKRWVGALRVVGKSDDATAIWSDEPYPERLAVEPLIVLEPEYGVPLDRLRGQLDFYRDERDEGGYRGFLRSSPAKFKVPGDGERVLALLEAAQATPERLEVDPRQLARRPSRSLYRAQGKVGARTIEAFVSVPEAEESANGEEGEPQAESVTATTRHTEIQHRLLQLGAEMGLDVWVARNDRSRVWKGVALGSMSGMVQQLPAQFNEVTQRTIELIDVLWLKGNSIVAAFEVECTTSIYSGLLRMSDLLSLQPNIDIKLYLVAPDERRDKVEQEIRRPTFALRAKPLTSVCGYLPFTDLTEQIDGIERLGIASALNPTFLEKVSEYFD